MHGILLDLMLCGWFQRLEYDVGARHDYRNGLCEARASLWASYAGEELRCKRGYGLHYLGHCLVLSSVQVADPRE
jgi:hypothetical protein